MNCLIIGASGLVGGNILYVFAQKNLVGKNIGTHIHFPVADTVYFDPLEDALPDEIAHTKWDVVIHTGALTHVDKCETESALSFTQTVLSTEKLLELAQKNKAKFLYISTDYVFDGRRGPYIETDQCNPINVYGKHKFEAENLVKAYDNHLIIRITNVYGKEVRNKNFVARILESLKTSESIDVVAPFDQYATPVNALDIAQAIWLLAKDDKKGTYHIAGTDYVSRVQLLQRINKYFENRIKIIAVATQSLSQVAARPLQGGLLMGRFLSEYPDFVSSNLDDYLREYIN